MARDCRTLYNLRLEQRILVYKEAQWIGPSIKQDILEFLEAGTTRRSTVGGIGHVFISIAYGEFWCHNEQLGRFNEYVNRTS
jgi:hypothetical protein